MKTRVFYVLLVFFSVSPVALLFLLLLGEKVIYNNTPSYPMGLYLVEKKASYDKGDLVLVCMGDNKDFLSKNKGYIKKSIIYCKNGFAPLIKKIVAMDGDKVEVTQREVLINGQKQKNSSLIEEVKPCYGVHTLKQGEMWIMSDYHPASFDSRYFGTVATKNILGGVRYFW